MVSIPRPRECIGVVGVAIAALGILTSFVVLLAGQFDTWTWYLFLASGTLLALSWLYCMNWFWERIPYSQT